MKAYLRNGKTIHINQKLANELSDMIVNKKENVLIQRNIITKNVTCCFNTDEIIVIK